MSYGYHGKILHVDLASGKTEVETPPESFYRTYMGGGAMALYYILREVPKGADPLGPNNLLTVFPSVVTGATIAGQSRINKQPGQNLFIAKVLITRYIRRQHA